MREYHFVRALARLGELTYLHFTDAGSEPLTRQDLPFCGEVIAVPKPATYGALKLAQGIFSRWPLPILNYTSVAMHDAVERLTTSQAYDLIHLDSIHMIRYSKAAVAQRSTCNVAYNWHNIESEAMQRFAATVSSPAKRWYANRTAAKLASLERDLLQTASGHIVCSTRELEDLRKIAPAAKIAVVENGVDVASFSAQPAQGFASRKIIFVGLMDYYPNVEAATSFTQNIWPGLRQKFPELTLWIVGANPTSPVRQLEKLDGVTVTGTVPEVRPFYRDALAAIVPLRTGGGTRLKILEAMAAGVPVVSTPLGAEGLNVTEDQSILLANPDDAAAWQRHLAYLMESAANWQALSAAALTLVRTQYDWEMLGRKLCHTYEGWLRSKA